MLTRHPPLVASAGRSWLRCRGDTLRRTPASRASRASRHIAAMEHAAHAMGTVGRVSTEAFNPAATCAPGISRTSRPTSARSYYRETPRPDGTLLREYEIFAVDREIEIAPGMFFPAWTYNGQVPGPDDPRHRRRSRQRHVPEPGLASAHDPLPRLASARDGRRRCPSSRCMPGEHVRLRVRRRAVRPAPLSLPHRAAEAAHPQGPVRRVHHRSARRRVRRPTSS